MLESQISKKVVQALKGVGYLVNTLPKPKGWPDIQAFKDGKVVNIEVKRPGKNPTELQKVIHKRFELKGFDVYIIRSVNDLREHNLI